MSQYFNRIGNAVSLIPNQKSSQNDMPQPGLNCTRRCCIKYKPIITGLTNQEWCGIDRSRKTAPRSGKLDHTWLVLYRVVLAYKVPSSHLCLASQEPGILGRLTLTTCTSLGRHGMSRHCTFAPLSSCIRTRTNRHADDERRIVWSH
jgi:hypothetical protein